MQILALDFEGSLSNGIREIGLITSVNSTIVSLAEQTIRNEAECIEFFKTIFKKIPDFIISHNVPTERNLLKKYLPYKPHQVCLVGCDGVRVLGRTKFLLEPHRVCLVVRNVCAV